MWYYFWVFGASENAQEMACCWCCHGEIANRRPRGMGMRQGVYTSFFALNCSRSFCIFHSLYPSFSFFFKKIIYGNYCIWEVVVLEQVDKNAWKITIWSHVNCMNFASSAFNFCFMESKKPIPSRFHLQSAALAFWTIFSRVKSWDKIFVKREKTKTSFLPQKVVCEPCLFHVN